MRLFYVIILNLRRKTGDFPIVITLKFIDNSVVQTVWPSLPKFYFVGLSQITTPIFRSWNFFIHKFFFQIFQFIFQKIPIRNHLTLWRNHCSELATFRPRLKISVTEIFRKPFQICFNNYLPFQRRPKKVKTGLFIAFNCFAFAAIVIGVEYKAFPSVRFQKHHSGPRATIVFKRGNRHRIRFRNIGILTCLQKPVSELLHRIFFYLVFKKLRFFVDFSFIV